jgi:2-phospho-L-lactate/phosphoenolpyruvate guanylyltransferase
MRTAAILPVKRFSLAKQRLGASVAEQLRERLAQAMVADVLHALSCVRGIERTMLVTRERSLARAAHAPGVLLLEDEAEAGQSEAVTIGVRRAIADGFARVLCIPGDCPALDPGELELLLRAGSGETSGAHGSGAAEVVIVPDRHGSGTNGLLLSPPDAIAPSFGPDSCRRHVALARAAGVRYRLERLPSLLLDIDTGADLAALRTQGAADEESDRAARGQAHGAAVRTRALLRSGGPADVVSVTGRS